MLQKRMSSRHADPFFGGWSARNAAAVNEHPVVERGVRRRWIGGAAVVGVAAAVTVPLVSASADPSPHAWWQLRVCESGNRYDLNTGNGHYGAYQFDLPTWRSVGGHGYPNRASKAVQDARALILYRERGWQPWECAAMLGLRPDADAGSGYIADIHVPHGHRQHVKPHRHRQPVKHTRHRVSAGHIPPFPGGSNWYYYGEWNRHIKTFQDEMHRRGYFPVGTGQYGPHTLQMVKQLQRLNGLVPDGALGPNTWRLAWIGQYRTP